MRQPRPKVPATGELLLEYNGPSEGWAVITEAGQIINGPLLTAPGLAYYLRQHQLGQRVSNLDALESKQLVEIAKTVVRK